MRIVVLIALALLAAPAAAGTYDVVSCRAPVAGGANGAWDPGYGAYWFQARLGTQRTYPYAAASSNRATVRVTR